MELLQLKYFLEVAKSEHINKTAEKMSVTPSAVSISISKLEKELGIELFNRYGRNIVLNDKGKLFAKHIEEMFDSLNSAINSISPTEISKKGIEVCLVNPYLWNNSITAFHRAYPQIPINVSELNQGESVKRPADIIARTHADLFIASSEYFDGCNLRSEEVIDSPLYIAMSKNHKLAKRKSLKLSELKDEWFINSPRGTTFRKFCDGLCLNEGYIPKSHVECDYMVRPDIINSGSEAVCICTMLGKESGLYDKTVLVQMVDPNVTRKFVASWNPKYELSEQARLFINFIRDYYKDYKITK